MKYNIQEKVIIDRTQAMPFPAPQYPLKSLQIIFDAIAAHLAGLAKSFEVYSNE